MSGVPHIKGWLSLVVSGLQVVRQAYAAAFPAPSARCPVAVVTIDVLPQEVDVNLEPNKTTVMLHNVVS